MTTYRITSTAGADHGTYEGETAAAALAAMHQDAGYEGVTADGDELHFPDDETAELCGGLEDWTVAEVETLTPAERWNLDEFSRVTVGGIEYVVYGDGAYSWAIKAERFDRPTTETDYSEWCQVESAEGNEELCQAIADASRVALYTASACTLIQPRVAS